MRSVIHLSLRKEIPYYKEGRICSMLDRFKTNMISEDIIPELKTKVKFINIPANLNNKSYNKNVQRSYEKYSEDKSILSSSCIRMLDLPIMSSFQRRINAYSVVESIKIILQKSQKSIRNSNILIEDGAYKYNKEIIEELSKEAKNIIVVTKDYKKLDKLRDKMLCDYGTTIEVLNEECKLKYIDFIISSENKNYNSSRVWYIDNLYMPNNNNKLSVNGIGFKVPWESSIEYLPPELIGGIIKEEKNKDIRELLRKNDILLEYISFNSKEIVF